MAALGTFAGTGLSQVVMGGAQDFILDDTGWDRRSLALAVTTGTWLSGLMGPLMGHLADRVGPRWLMPLGVALVGIVFLIIAGVNSFSIFFIVYVTGRGLSNTTLIGIVPRTTAVNFFRKRRNIALAITSTFRPVSSAINIQIISLFVSMLGWRSAYWFLSIVSFSLILPLAIVMRRKPEDIGLLPDGDNRADDDANKSTESISLDGQKDEVSWATASTIRTSAFWLIGMSVVFGILASSTLSFSMVPYLHQSVGISSAQATGILSLSTFLALAVIAWGYAADRVSPRLLLLIALPAASVITLYLLTVDSLFTAYLFGIIWGIFAGALGVLEQMLLAQYFGRGSYGAITGAMAPMQMIALGLGPALAAILSEATGAYTVQFVIVSSLYIAAGVMIYWAKPPILKTV